MPAGEEDPVRVHAEFLAEQDRVYTKLLGCPLVDIDGVMSPVAAAGAGHPDGTHWTLRFELAVWRFNGTRIETRPLTVLRRVGREELESLFQRLRPLETVRLRARFRRLPTDFSFNAILEEIVGPSEDAELATRARELKIPVTYEDPRLGVFTLDRSSRSFSAKSRWMGHEIRVAACVETVQDLNKELMTLHKLWSAQAEWDRRAREYAANELLAVKNQSWLDEGESPIGSADFIGRMELEEVTVSDAGAFGFWFGDSDLFWGHSIQVVGTLANGFTRADLAG